MLRPPQAAGPARCADVAGSLFQPSVVGQRRANGRGGPRKGGVPCHGKAPVQQSARPRRSIAARASGSNGEAHLAAAEMERRKHTFVKFVLDCQPAVMEQFVEQAPVHVVNGMRSTITNMLGTLPPAFFTVTVSTVGENLAQLMYSVMLTGYMFRNAQYRMELHSALGSLPTFSGPLAAAAAAATGPSSSSGSAFSQATQSLGRAASGASASTSSSDGGDGALRRAGSAPAEGSWLDDEACDKYAPGTQKLRVSGSVLRWHEENGVEEMEAGEYMVLLEEENTRLRAMLANGGAGAQAAALPAPGPAAAPLMRSSSDTDSTPLGNGSSSEAAHALALRSAELPNELLDYIKSLAEAEPASLAELTAGGPEVTAAMDAFVERLLGTDDKDRLRRAGSECTAQELGRLMFWLMVVGYTLRNMEVRMDMDSSLDLAGGGSSGNGRQGLPPGRG